MAYKIHYYRDFQDSDEYGKLFINTEEYFFDDVYNTIEEAEIELNNIARDLNRYPGVTFGYEAQRHTLWAEDNIYGQESWQIIEA